MGGETAIGGKEVVVIMARDPGAQNAGACEYRLLATSGPQTPAEAWLSWNAKQAESIGQSWYVRGLELTRTEGENGPADLE
jgi:hypothetical protein